MKALSDNRNKTAESDGWVEDIVAQYERPLQGYFRRRVDTAADADDLVQEVFARLSQLSTPAEVSNPAAYVFSVAANLLRDRARRNGARRRDRHEPFDDAMHGIDRGDSPESRAVAGEDLANVARVVASLPTKTKTIFLLHRFDGLKYREIAEVMDTSVSTVEKHMIAALVALGASVRRGEG